jgi:5-methylcytosine-specific restriction endonuclease McrA
MPAPYDCVQCGTSCIPGENVVAHASRFCGRACLRVWHKQHVEIPAMLFDSLTAEAKPYDLVAYRRAVRRDPCVYCGSPGQALDHVVPRSHGGLDDWTNRASACHACNGGKMQTPLLVFLAWKRARDDFEPWRQIVASIHTRAA